jgi:hypothetical protein
MQGLARPHPSRRTNPLAPGCAFVTFDTWAEAEGALQAVDGKVSLPGSGHAMAVKFADAKPGELAKFEARGTKRGAWEMGAAMGGVVPAADSSGGKRQFMGGMGRGVMVRAEGRGAGCVPAPEEGQTDRPEEQARLWPASSRHMRLVPAARVVMEVVARSCPQLTAHPANPPLPPNPAAWHEPRLDDEPNDDGERAPRRPAVPLCRDCFRCFCAVARALPPARAGGAPAPRRPRPTLPARPTQPQGMMAPMMNPMMNPMMMVGAGLLRPSGGLGRVHTI